MKYGIRDEYITDNFIKIAKEMEELKGKIQWESDECTFSSNLPDATSLCNYLNEGFIKDNEQNQKIMDTLESLEEKLYDEGRKISKKIIEAKQKIPIYLISDAEELIEDVLEEIQEEKNLKLDNQSLKDKIKLYFELFIHIDISYIQNPYLVLEKDIEEDDEFTYACLDEDYYEVSIQDL